MIFPDGCLILKLIYVNRYFNTWSEGNSVKIVVICICTDKVL